MTVRNSIGVVDKVGANAVPIVSTSDARNSLAALVRRSAGARPKQGIMRGNPTGDLVVTGTSGWAYSVQAGDLIVAPDAASGVYPVPNDGVVSVPTVAKPGTGSRIDIIVMGQADAWDRSGAATAPVLTCISGVATTGSPAAPAVPDGCLEIARNVMTSAATTTASAGNTITQTAPFTTSPGGMQFYRNATEETADLATRQAGDPAYLGSTQKATVGTATGAAQLLARALGNGINGGNVVFSFATIAAMNASSVSPIEGDYADVNEVDCLFRYSGTAWVPHTVGGVASQSALAALPAIQGLTLRAADTGVMWTYLSAYNALTNPRGATPAGWYPLDGLHPSMRAVASGNAATATSLTLGASTGAFLPFTSIDDFYGWRDPANPSRIRPLVPGKYSFQIISSWGTSSTGNRSIQVRKNGGSLPGGNAVFPATVNTEGSSLVLLEVDMNGTTDYFEVIVAHSAGGTIPTIQQITVEWVGTLR